MSTSRRARAALSRIATVATLAATAAITITGTIAGTPGVAGAAGSVPLSTGLNDDGQLGTGTTTQRTTPGPITGPLATAANVVQIASGREHAYALDDTGRVWAWGDNSKGAVGDGTSTDRRTPVQLSLTGVVEIEAGHYHGIARRSDGSVWTWGYGNIGQLGLGTTNNRNAPVQVPGLSGIIAVAAGRDMSYALASDGTMWGWGNNTFGEVGDGTTTRRLSPVRVQGITGVVEIAGGRNHALVRRADGSLWGWGANDFGQLGLGNTTSRSLPVQILPGPVAHVDTGAEHSLALMVDGTVRSWGRGQRGQLGLGTTNMRTTPQPVPALGGIVEIGDGRDQSFAFNAAGEVWAWGMNDTGQLGDGTTTNRLSPVKLANLTGIVAAQGGRGMTIFLPGATAPTPDVVPPTAPGRPSGTSTVAGRVDLTWAAATDDRAATLQYRVFVDGETTPVATVPGGTTGTIGFSHTGLAPGSVHTWHVTAFDGTNEGPASVASAPVTVASPPAGPTVLVQNDFANGLSGWTSVSGMVVDNATGSPTNAPPSARVASSNQRGSAQLPVPSPTTAACAAFDVRITSVSGTARTSVAKLRGVSGGSFARVQVDSGRRLSVRADIPGTTLNLQTPTTLAANTWHRLRLCASVAVSGGTLRLEVNGAVVGSWTVNTGSSPLARVQLGDNDPRTITANWDAVVVTAGTA